MIERNFFAPNTRMLTMGNTNCLSFRTFALITVFARLDFALC